MSSPGILTYSAGYVYDQTLLLQKAVNGLDVFNSMINPLEDRLSKMMTEQTARVSQAPLTFNREGEGALPGAQKVQYRLLKFPLETFDARTAWTVTGMEDALESDVMDETEAAMKGAIERRMGLLMASIFRYRTSGSVGTEYEASFFAGETDVPSYGENTFGSAHYHYKGTGSATLARSHITNAIEDVTEHGYSPDLALFSPYQAAAVLDVLDSSSTNVTTPERIKAVDNGVLAGVTTCGLDVAFSTGVPNGYFAVMDSRVQPVGRREHPNPKNRGLRLESGPRDSAPLVDAYFRLRVGFRARILGAVACRYLTAGGSAFGNYSNPTMRFQ